MENEEPVKAVKEDEKYNPKEGFEWVAAFLAVVMTLTKCALLVVPYLAAVYLDNEQAAIMASIQVNESFNLIWVMVITYWVGKKVIDQPRL